MKFLFDNNLPPKLARELTALVSPDHEVVHLRDKFAPNTEDSAWLGELDTDLAIVTGDVRAGKNPHEVRAWKEGGHTVFFLKPGWTDMPFEDQARKFTKSLPEMAKAAAAAEPGTSFVVTTTGKIVLHTCS